MDVKIGVLRILRQRFTAGIRLPQVFEPELLLDGEC